MDVQVETQRMCGDCRSTPLEPTGVDGHRFWECPSCGYISLS